MIRVEIEKTGKGYGKNEGYHMFDRETKTFKDMLEVKKFLKETYGKCKRVPSYVDTKDGEVKKVGYVYCFKNADLSHYPVEKWLQQDWVSFFELKQIYLR